MNAYFNGLKNYANFSGRATRPQFWLFMLIATVLCIVVVIIDAAVQGPDTNYVMSPIPRIVILAHVLPSWAIQARRLHDTDRSGWWQLISIIPFGFIVTFVFFCSPSTPGPNRYDTPAGKMPAAPAPVSNVINVHAGTAVERLEKLAALKAAGALDDAEFQKLKSDILAQGK